MLLQTLPFFGNSWCNNVWLIPKFMKSVFRKTPPKPRYLFTWDVSTVLRFLKSLTPLSKLSIKLLTLKTVALITLATAPRAQTLVSLKLSNMVVQQQVVVFAFTDLLKTSCKSNSASFSLKVEHFKDEDLCAMHTLMFYLKCVKKHRKDNQVFVSYKTFKAVTTSTIARWLKDVLNLSGIDSDLFKAHSFRGAATTCAHEKGCSLKLILETADWKSDKNFRKFYYRQTVSKKGSFAYTVLNSLQD